MKRDWKTFSKYSFKTFKSSLIALFLVPLFYIILNPHFNTSESYVGGLFQFVYAENPGAFLGLGGSWSREVRFVIFALIVFFGLGGMLWYLIKREQLRVNLFAYSFILAGGFGNLWDRVFHEDGHVIDFMLMEVWGPLRTGVFNVADVFIVAGVLMALLAEYLMKRSAASTDKPAQ